MGARVKAVIMGLVFLLAGPASVWAGGATPSMVKEDIARFTALGATYQPQGFIEMKAQETPYQRFRRVDTARLMGRVVYSLHGRIRIWKQLFWGNLEVIFLELSLRDAAGKRYPFAWQDCSLICQHEGACSGQNPLYVDLDGDGRAEIPVSGTGFHLHLGHRGRLGYPQELFPGHHPLLGQGRRGP